jgi:hypothetical protein
MKNITDYHKVKAGDTFLGVENRLNPDLLMLNHRTRVSAVRRQGRAPPPKSENVTFEFLREKK